MADVIDGNALQAAVGIDIVTWRDDLQRLHTTIDQVVQSFVAGQSRQMDVVAAELRSQRDQIASKEHQFNELSESIAGFVEEEAKRLEFLGLPLNDAEADLRQEAYDAQLPGPPALHRINRLWRKAIRAFEASREAASREATRALEEQRACCEGSLMEAEQRLQALGKEQEQKLAVVQKDLEAARGDGEQKDGVARALSSQVGDLKVQLEAAQREAAALVKKLGDAEALKHRLTYEWETEREELTRTRDASNLRVLELERLAKEAQDREVDLTNQCQDSTHKALQMQKVMQDQEIELTKKIDRVQQYVKERQTGALHAEKKQLDAERMAERWQGEVRRLQAERDELAALVLDLESRQSGQVKEIQGAKDHHQRDVSALQEQLRRKEEEMRHTNLQLLQQRDQEYQAKVTIEKQREKDRSVAMLRKKEQEVIVKDQQLRAARLRIQELESGSAIASSPSADQRLPSRGSGSDGSLPPLPLSAR